MWYFRDKGQIPDDVVKGSLIRACTTSFGSICFGSLLVAIITTIRIIAESAARSRNNNIFVRLFCCFVACILRVMEDILNYFNRYAYTFVSIYGEAYIPSAKRAFKLFAHYGFGFFFFFYLFITHLKDEFLIDNLNRRNNERFVDRKCNWNGMFLGSDALCISSIRNCDLL